MKRLINVLKTGIHLPSTATAIFLACVTISIATVSAHAAEIWLGPVDPVTQAARHWQTSVDFMDLFKPDAPWQTVAGHTKVFKIGPGFVQQGKEEDLKRIFSELQRRHIGLVVEIGFLTTSDHCAARNEAYGPPGLVEGLLMRLKRLGADVQYVAMDEPLEYGHWAQGANACHETVEEIASEVAVNVAVVKRIFPNARVGDTEVVTLSPELLGDIEKWVDAYQKAVGEPLAFFHADMAWSHHAMKHLVPLSAFLKSRHVPFGVIYNGGDAKGDDAWASAAESYYDEIESGLGVQPDAAVFHTWVPYPTHVLPEDQTGTLTNIILKYLRPAPRLSFQRIGGTLSGNLSFGPGKPLVGAPIIIQAVDVHGKAGLELKTYSGQIPAKAAMADLGVRINIEGSCACSGPVTATIGTAHYREEGKGGVETFALGGPPLPRQFAVGSRAQTVVVNSRTFPVTPGATYSVDFPISTTWNSENAGYVALIFLSQNGKQVGRDIWRFTPKEWTIAKPQTDSTGAFHFEIPSDIAHLDASFRAIYAGSASVRSAMGLLQ